MFRGIPQTRDTTVPIENNCANGNNKIKNKRTRVIVPLIVMSKLVAEKLASFFAYYLLK